MKLEELQSGVGSQMAAAQTAYLLVYGLANWWWLRRWGVEMAPWYLLVCLLPVLLCVVLVLTPRTDEEQYKMRLMVCFLMTPVLLLFWSATQASTGARAVWPVATGIAVVHAAAFVAAIFVMGTESTLVPPAEGMNPVPARTLTARLNSLRSPKLQLTSDGQKLVFTFAIAEGRHQDAVLLLDATGTEVRVTERMHAVGAKPMNAGEASMRAPGEPAFDPGRPQADLVYEHLIQTRVILPERLTAVPLTLTGDAALVPEQYLAAAGEHEIVTLLCAVVTRSGWTWRPVWRHAATA